MNRFTTKMLEVAPGEELQKFLAFVSIIWGAWVLMPWRAFPAVEYESAVGLLSLTVGILKWSACRLNNGMTRTSAALSGLSWLVILYEVQSHYPFSTGTAMYGTHAVANIWVAIRRSNGSAR